MSKDEALKLALDALEPQEFWAEWYLQDHVIPKAIEAIKKALAQSEPVAWEQFYPEMGKPKLKEKHE